MMNFQQLLNNPMLQMITNGGNPEQMVMQLLNQNPAIKNNKLVQNCLQMMQNGNQKGAETVALNALKECGYNPDTLMNMVNKSKK